jgi:PAS domain S-box-containing protein
MSAVMWHTDGAGHVRTVNPTWSAFTGQVFDEYEGDGWLEALHPDDRAATVQAWRDATAARHPFVGSYRLRRHDGHYRHMLARGAAVMAGDSVLEWVGSCLDVTDMRTAQEALRVANVRLQFTLDSAQIADWDYDPATGLLAASPRLARVFGYGTPQPPWDMRHLLGHIHGEDRAAALAGFEEALRTAGPWQMECRIVHPDGAVRWVAAHGNSYRDEESTGARMLGIVYDITAHKRSEQALRETDRRKDEFLAMLAHELRNPLAPIGAASEVLAVARNDPERTGLASAVIRRQVRHMTGLIDDLLDVSRVKRGLVKLETAPCDMGAVVTGALEQVRPLLDRRGHSVHVDLPALPATVNGDEKRLVQIIANLLNNAAKYTPDRGRIAVAVALCGAAVTCTVTDNGIGMSPDFVERAFDVFAQADQSIARSQGGLGLGLALARSLVTAHGGSIEARSEGPGKGAAFTVTLPAL